MYTSSSFTPPHFVFRKALSRSEKLEWLSGQHIFITQEGGGLVINVKLAPHVIRKCIQLLLFVCAVENHRLCC